MLRRTARTIAALAAICLIGVGCAGAAPPDERPAAAAFATPVEYLTGIEALLDPPARMASLIAAQAKGTDPAPVTQGDVESILGAAQGRLDAVRAMRIDDGALRRQRDVIAAAYPAVIGAMRGVASELVAADHAGVVRTARPFFSSVRSLSSVVSSPSR